MTRKLIVILCLVLISSFGFAEDESKKYKEGQKVEVFVEGNWVEGTYNKWIGIYSNMKETPHNARFETSYGLKGSQPFKPSEIRLPTGTIKPLFTKQAAAGSINTSKLEDDIIKEINILRSNPAAYANKLAGLKSKYVKAGGKLWYLDIPGEGGIYIGDSDAAKADHEKWLNETISELQRTPVLSTPVVKNDLLRKSADMLASDTGNINGPAHKDSQGRDPFKRAEVAGYKNYEGFNECLASMYVSGFGYIQAYLIDWKVESRGHRKNLLAPKINEIGVACKFHNDANGGYIRNVIQQGFRSKDQQTKTPVTDAKKPDMKQPDTKLPDTKKPDDKAIAGSDYTVVIASGNEQSYSGGGMPQPMVIKIKSTKTNKFIEDLRAEGLTIDVVSSKVGKYDGPFNNLNNYCKNGDKSCYGGYYYVQSNSGQAPYSLTITVNIKKGDKVVSSCTFVQKIKG